MTGQERCLQGTGICRVAKTANQESWQTNTGTNTTQYERHLSRSLTSTCQVTMGRTGAELSAGQALVASGIIGDWEQVCRDTPIFTGLLQCAVAPLRG